MKGINVFSSRPRGYGPFMVVEEVARRITDYRFDYIYSSWLNIYALLQSSCEICGISQLRCSREEVARDVSADICLTNS